jgi:DNA-directed RNA polymerase subunit M/transcription elongation factor TFIIS
MDLLIILLLEYFDMDGSNYVMQATARGEEGMVLFIVCCNPSCGYRWRD